ncbi:prepilin-type N-terminal cleavage/methylation domain-containing protein [Variovorax sp. J22R115]|uniref:prepilin-type N-terminal cleavage/methylation domain-containing protein n=1 Tax=Variovorax sp. J22R115 TaxID=3053509 RepID=UPI0025762B43|nr:prepilin-type N-terminal cleavage/methylation domain-containing protein [Variovorax sp. J22R115]MDM0049772.1 prepilin-type N-terminal cleavage/methylation domain-containing protein [Variovorax sp. J22R115]
MLTRRRVAGRVAGFTLIEMLVTMVVLTILVGLAMPSMSAWIRNSRLRTVSDSLQDGLRLAQTESLRRSRQVVFSLTDDKATSTTYTAKRNGKNWVIKTVPSMMADETSAFIESGVLTDLGSTISITGPASICFNSLGRVVANDNPGENAGTCSLPTSAPPVQTYGVTYSDLNLGADRPLQVNVALGGQVRLCDPAKTLDATHPDGCPP